MNNNEELFAGLDPQVHPLVPPEFIQAIQAIHSNTLLRSYRSCRCLQIYEEYFDFILEDSDGHKSLHAPGGGDRVGWNLCRFQGQLYFVFSFPPNIYSHTFDARETSMNEVLKLLANEGGGLFDNNGFCHRLQSIRPDLVIPPPDQLDDSLIPLFGNIPNEGLIEPLPNQLVADLIAESDDEESDDEESNEEESDEDYDEEDDLQQADEEGFLTPPRNQLAADLIAESDDEESDDEESDDEESADHESDENYHEDEGDEDEDDEDESYENYDEDDVEVVQEAEQNVVSGKRKRKQTRFYKPDKRSTSSHR